jgi:ribosomal protein S18 acetylase RimI-like enzyme
MCKAISRYTIENARDDDWQAIADLVAQGIPNIIITKLGRSFAAAFYEKVSAQEFSCTYVARDNFGNVAGVIIGSLDYSQAYSIAVKTQWLKLIFAANIRLLSWSVNGWIIKGVLAKLKNENRAPEHQPNARLIVVAVRPEARGTGLAASLVEKMEEFMLAQNLVGPYLIFTEKANTRANKFYEKIGAKLIRTNVHHGREINEWHKEIAVAKEDE